MSARLPASRRSFQEGRVVAVLMKDGSASVPPVEGVVAEAALGSACGTRHGAHYPRRHGARQEKKYDVPFSALGSSQHGTNPRTRARRSFNACSSANASCAVSRMDRYRFSTSASWQTSTGRDADPKRGGRRSCRRETRRVREDTGGLRGLS